MILQDGGPLCQVPHGHKGQSATEGQSTPDPPKSAAGKKFKNSNKYDINTDDRKHTEGSKSKRKWICDQQFAFNILVNMKIGQSVVCCVCTDFQRSKAHKILEM